MNKGRIREEPGGKRHSEGRLPNTQSNKRMQPNGFKSMFTETTGAPVTGAARNSLANDYILYTMASVTKDDVL